MCDKTVIPANEEFLKALGENKLDSPLDIISETIEQMLKASAER